MTGCCSHMLRLSPETQPQQGLCCAPAPWGGHLPMAAASVPHPNPSYALEIPLGAPRAPWQAGQWWGCSLDVPPPRLRCAPKGCRTPTLPPALAKQEHPRPCTQLGQGNTSGSDCQVPQHPIALGSLIQRSKDACLYSK